METPQAKGGGEERSLSPHQMAAAHTEAVVAEREWGVPAFHGRRQRRVEPIAKRAR